MSQAPRTVSGMTRRRSFVFAMLPACVLLLTLEGGARVAELVVPPLAVDPGLGFAPDTRLFVPGQGRALKTAPEKRQSFVPQRFRLPKPPATFRIFVLGGSNVNYLQQELMSSARRLEHQAHGRLRVEYVNAGGLAYGSQRLVPIAAEVVNYDPDLLMVFAGHNEFEEAEQLAFANLRTVRLQRVLYRSALLRVTRDSLARWQVSLMTERRGRSRLPRADVDYAATARRVFTPEEIATRMAHYRRHLELIAETCRVRGVPLVIGTVPSNLFRPHLPAHLAEERAHIVALYDAGRHAEGLKHARQLLRHATRHQASDAENDIIREVAARYGLPLADVWTAVAAAEPHGVPGETLFTDRCHLNQAGQRLLLQKYEEQIAPFIRARAQSSS